MVKTMFKIGGLAMYKVIWTKNGYDFGFSWTFDTLAEAYEAMLEKRADGYDAEIIRG